VIKTELQLGLIILYTSGNTDFLRLLTVSFSVSFIVMVSGCTLFGGNSSGQDLNAWATVEETARELQRSFENEDTRDLLQRTHADYEQYRSELENNLENVFLTYSNIDLSFFGARANRTNGRIEADVRWDLRWVCQRPDSRADTSCDDSGDAGDTIKRAGRTTLVFEQDKYGWKLINQKQDRLFGSHQPGRLQ
jgi:hypothetical protein